MPNNKEVDATLTKLAADKGLQMPMAKLLEHRSKTGEPKSARYWAVADFTRNSTQPRLFIFDSNGAGSVKSYLCAHGKGSEGEKDDGLPTVFLNVKDSEASSLGIYRCAETYTGKHGASMRLDGLEPTNSLARDRCIVVHSAEYVSPKWIKDTGRIGRSQGCFVVEEPRRSEVISALKNGSLLIAWHQTYSLAG